MLIHILVEELEEKFINPWKSELICSVHIDYATNAIHGWYENEEHIIFKFRDYGFIHDNRYVIHDISSGRDGIKIQTTKPNNN